MILRIATVAPAVLCLFAACSGGGAGAGSTAPVSAQQRIGGRTLGGQQPVTSAAVSLYAASSSGYGATTTALATTTTDSSGNWSFSISCPAGNPQLYVVSIGGQSVAGGANSAIGLSAALGPCNTAVTETGLNIDEVTTVASAYALAPFLDSSGQFLGTSATNATGLNNAVANVALLADLQTGAANTTLPAGAFGTLPAATLNTLANILADCVNSVGGSSQCGSLMSAATPSGGAAPTTTLQAVLNIARNPGNNIAALYGLAAANAPFQTPAPLSAQPNDWTLTARYTGGGLANSQGLAIDANGALWVANNSSASSVNSGRGSVSEFLNSGVVASGSPFAPTGLNVATLVAVDPGGNVWVTDASSNGGHGSLYELSSGGSLEGSAHTAGITGPLALLSDASGDLWVLNSGTADKFIAASSYSNTAYSLGGSNATGAAFDASGNLWVSLYFSNELVVLSNSGTAVSGSPVSGGGLDNPEAVAIDGSGNIWVNNQQSASNVNGGNGSVSEFGANDAAASGSPFAPSGMQGPQADSIAVDGAGRVWVASSGAVSELNANGSAASPVSFGNDANLGALSAIAIDSSGDVWVASSNGSGSLSKLIGLATPVKTPQIGPAQLP